MITRFKRERKDMVALRKESVDRNHIFSQLSRCELGRSPQGERG